MVVRAGAEAPVGRSANPDVAGCVRQRALAQSWRSIATGHHTAGIRRRQGQMSAASSQPTDTRVTGRLGAVFESTERKLEWLGQSEDLGMPRFLPWLPKQRRLGSKPLSSARSPSGCVAPSVLTGRRVRSRRTDARSRKLLARPDHAFHSIRARTTESGLRGRRWHLRPGVRASGFSSP